VATSLTSAYLDLGLPVVRVVGRGEGAGAHRGALVGRCVDDRPDRGGDRIDIGRVDRDTAAGFACDRTHPRVIRADGRHTRGHRFKELVRRREVVVERVVLEQDTDHVRRGDPVEELGRRDGRDDVDPALVLRTFGRGPEFGLQRAIPHDDEDAAGDLADRGHQLLHTAPHREAALVEHDAGLGVQAEAFVEPSRLRRG
jgi:hypothetical protein